MFAAQGDGHFRGEAVLIAGVVLQYIATRISMAAIARADGSSPGRQALAQWLPIVATVLAAVAMGQPEIAITLIFGSAVACLSLVLGMTTYVEPVRQLPAERRVWPLALPAALLLLLAGFHGSLTWYHGLMLLVMGAAFLGVWIERPRPEAAPEQAAAPADRSIAPPAHPLNYAARAVVPPAQKTSLTISPQFIVLAMALAGVGGWIIIRGAVGTSQNSRVLTAGLLGATVLGPLLLLPALGMGTVLAQGGHTSRMVTALCGTVLLNLCLLLPLVILIEYFVGRFTGNSRLTTFPLVTWRLDTVLLVVLSFALLPVAAGRWLPQRIEAIFLVVIYAAYLVARTALSARLIG
jgi:Ca2+/Na+ antiporter